MMSPGMRLRTALVLALQIGAFALGVVAAFDDCAEAVEGSCRSCADACACCPHACPVEAMVVSRPVPVSELLRIASETSVAEGHPVGILHVPKA